MLAIDVKRLIRDTLTNISCSQQLVFVLRMFLLLVEYNMGMYVRTW